MRVLFCGNHVVDPCFKYKEWKYLGRREVKTPEIRRVSQNLKEQRWFQISIINAV